MAKLSTWLSKAANWEVPLAEKFLPSVLKTGLSANQVTLATLLVGLFGLVEVAWEVPVVGGLLLWLARWGDHLDGMVARAKGESSVKGAYYDAGTGLVLMTGIMAAIGYRFDDPTLIGVGVATAVAIRAVAVWLSKYLKSEHINVVHEFGHKYGKMGYWLENEFGFVPVWTILPLAFMDGGLVVWGWAYTLGQIAFMLWLIYAGVKHKRSNG